MKLRTRLILSFLALTIVPVIVMLTVMFSFTYVQMQEIQNFYGVELEGYEGLSNSSKLLTRLTSDIYQSLVQSAEKDVGRFTYEPYLNETNETLQNQSSYLVIRRDAKIVYDGGNVGIPYLEYLLPEFGENFDGKKGCQYVSNENVLLRGIDFYFEDGTSGSAYIVTYVEQMIPQLRQLLSRLIVAVVVIMLITAGIFTITTYRSLVAPVYDLQEAVHHMQEGNLDYAIADTSKGSEEFAMLCSDFEKMRLELKNSMEEKRKYDQESRELIANISHDLKTPMTSIKGYIEGIRDGVADTPEKMERYMTTIYNKTTEMNRLVNELNFYSKIETNQIPYNFITMNISDYFNDCVEELSIDLEAKNIKLTYVDYTDGTIMVKADPEQIARVVNNIVGNSAKYMDKEAGIINIYLIDNGKEVEVEIEDNGQGIAEKDLPNIFERFYRADASRNSKQGGSGIGLSIVKKIINDHGGRIWATSKEKKGTTVFFCLKKCQEE